MKLRTIEKTMDNDSSKAIQEVFDDWKQSDKIEFTWESLFKELDSLKIEKRILTDIKRNVIKDLIESKKQ